MRTCATSSSSGRCRAWTCCSPTCPPAWDRRSRSTASARSCRRRMRASSAGSRRSNGSTCAARLAPFGSSRIRAVRKERKLYFWDWSRVDDPGARVENLVAGHLLKYCHLVEDTEEYAMSCASCATPTGARSTSSCSVTAAPSSPSNTRTAKRGPGVPLLPRADRHSQILPGAPGHHGLWRCRNRHTRSALLDLCAELALP